jgi:hypothetical protein
MEGEGCSVPISLFPSSFPHSIEQFEAMKGRLEGAAISIDDRIKSRSSPIKRAPKDLLNAKISKKFTFSSA